MGVPHVNTDCANAVNHSSLVDAALGQSISRSGRSLTTFPDGCSSSGQVAEACFVPAAWEAERGPKYVQCAVR